MKNKKEELLQKFASMSWILLEHEVMYFLSHSNGLYIDESWIELRKISDEQYDKKLNAYKKIAKALKQNPERPVGCKRDSGSVKLVLSNFLAPILEFGRVPHVWPDMETETENEITLRTYLETELEDSQLELPQSS